jgi:hypothetical protein
MATGNFVSYLRVSTARQGQSGLGLEAQRKAVDDYLNGGHWTVIQEFVEVESGKNNDRAELAKAMALCRLRNAVLVIAKIDRLSRDAHFLLGLQKAVVRFVAADMPEANGAPDLRGLFAASGRVVATGSFRVGPLAHLLNNRFYIGEVAYRGEIFHGEHPAILDRGLFEAVQARLAGQAVERKLKRSASPSILAGLIFSTTAAMR